MEPAAPAFSIVVAAHNERAVIVRSLRVFASDLEPGEARVIVVANGCTDDTAELARSVQGVEVVELGVASKAAALNAGDAAAGHVFPRIYLDADIRVAASTLRVLAAELGEPGCLAGAPSVHFVTEGRTWPVRAFYVVYGDLPYVRESMIGLGLYGLSQAGRARFADFPSITADDLFVQRLFSRGERRISEGSFDVETPRNLRSLISVRTRTAYGNRELTEANPGSPRFAGSTAGTRSALLGRVRRDPRILPAVAVYVGVTLTARLLARRRGAGRWQRDSSTRPS
jgi:glycosyltransferase involved in cell wall biosynthesis